jgi:hypothetical protein
LLNPSQARAANGTNSIVATKVDRVIELFMVGLLLGSVPIKGADLRHRRSIPTNAAAKDISSHPE